MADTYTKVAISAAEFELIEKVRERAKNIQQGINSNVLSISYLNIVATSLQEFDVFTCRAIIESIHDNATGFKKQETRLICEILRNELNV